MAMNNKIMTLKTTKIILFAGLIAAMILPFSTIDFADAQNGPGEEDFTDEIGPVANVYDPYLEVLKQQDFYQNMTSDEQEEYVQAINEFKAEQNPYQSTVQELIDIGSQLTLNLQQAKADDDAEKIQNLEAELFALMETLKIYGVVTSEELDKNPSYWAQQAKNASDVIDNDSVSSVCFELGSDLNCGGQAEMYASLITDGIMPIHTSDISLENKAYIWFPIAEIGGYVIHIPTWDTEFGPSTVSTEVENIPYPDRVRFWSEVCSTNNVDHNSVRYHQSSSEEMHNGFGTKTHDRSYGGYGSVVGSSWLAKCTNISHYVDNDVLDTAELESTLGSTITVTGSHA